MLAQRQGLRAHEGQRARALGWAEGKSHQAVDHVLQGYRLYLRHTAFRQRHPGQQGQPVEQARAFDAGAMDQGWLHDGGGQAQGAQRVVGHLLAAVKGRGRLRVGAQGRELHHVLHARHGATVKKLDRPVGVHGLETIGAALADDARGVDDHVDVGQLAHPPLPRGRIGKIGLQPSTGGRHDADAPLRQRGDQGAANGVGSTHHRDLHARHAREARLMAASADFPWPRQDRQETRTPWGFGVVGGAARCGHAAPCLGPQPGGPCH